VSASSKIEWTEKVWNPVTGCTEVSPGCDHCYAKTFAERWRGVAGHPFERGFDLTLRPERLQDPFRWRKPQRVFVNSMSDLFHKDVPDEFIAQVFATMLGADRHTFQLLTKRPERLRRVVAKIYGGALSIPMYGVLGTRVPMPPLAHVWLGVSIESNDYAWRADMLRQAPNAVPWISFEPLLGPCDRVDLTGIHWAVIGGESGPGARPIDLAWIRDIIARCRAAGVAVFVKQLGAVWSAWVDDGGRGADPKGGDMSRWPEELRIREYPAIGVVA
jgi:protein gp37